MHKLLNRGVATQKTDDYSKFQMWDWFIRSFFFFFFSFFHFFRLQGLISIKCVIRQFLASRELIVDMIFE